MGSGINVELITSVFNSSLTQLPSATVTVSTVNNADHILFPSHIIQTCIIFLHQIVPLPGITGRQGLEEIVEIHHDFIQREDVLHHNSMLIDVQHILLGRSAILRHRRTERGC